MKALLSKYVICLFFLVCCLTAFAQREIHYADYRFQQEGPQSAYRYFSMDGRPLNGFCRIQENSRYTFTVRFIDGYMQGEYTKYDQWGEVRSKGGYRNGVRHGEFTEYTPSGNLLWQRYYKDGKRIGKHVSYYVDGSINREIHYKDGLQDGPEFAYSWEGELIKMMNYREGNPDGRQWFLTYHNNGNFTTESYYINGVPEGDYRETYHDGTPRMTGRYRNGIKVGKWVLVRRYLRPNGEFVEKMEVTDYGNEVPEFTREIDGSREL